MTHPPQEILIKVMCSERLPSESGDYLTNMRICYFYKPYNSFINEFGSKLNPSYWYEPATRVVLTVEEYEAAMRSQYLAGYNDNATPSVNP